MTEKSQVYFFRRLVMNLPCITDITVQDIDGFAQTTKLTFLQEADESKRDREIVGSLRDGSDSYAYNVSRMITFGGERAYSLMEIIIKFMYNGFESIVKRDRFGMFVNGSAPVCEVTLIHNDQIHCFNGEGNDPNRAVANLIVDGRSIYSSDFSNLFYVSKKIIVLDLAEMISICQQAFENSDDGFKDLIEFVILVLKMMMARNQLFIQCPPIVRDYPHSDDLFSFLTNNGEYYDFRDETFGSSPLIVNNIAFKKIS